MWKEIIKMPPSVDEYKRIVEEAYGTKSTKPFKGSRHRQKHGWTEKLNTFEDTNTFLMILDEIHSFNKEEIFYFLGKPYKYQAEYEIFKDALELMGDYENVEGLDDGNFVEWFTENYSLDWNALRNDLKKLKE
jgi:hypothetical protein